MLPKYL